MTDFCFKTSGVAELSTILQLHQNFVSAENPESAYVLYGKRRHNVVDIYRSVMVHNSHPDPVDGFQVRQSDLDDASAHLLHAEPWLEVVGVVHTHEGPESPQPSQEDVQSVTPGHLHVIACPQHGAIVFYDGTGHWQVWHHREDGEFVNRRAQTTLREHIIHTYDPHPHERDDR